AAPDRRTVHSRDHRLVAIEQRTGPGMRRLHPGAHGWRLSTLRGLHGPDVSAGAERLTRPGDDHRAHVFIADKRKNTLLHTGLHGGRKRVHGARVVEAQDGDGTMALDLYGFRHALLLCSRPTAVLPRPENVAPVLVRHVPACSHHVAFDHLPQQA